MANTEKELTQSQTTEKKSSALKTTGKVIKTIGVWLFRIRAIFMAIPVLLAAVRLAAYCRENLPEMVGHLR